MKNSLVLLSLALVLLACKTENRHQFTIDTSIIDTVNSKISLPESDNPFEGLFLMYENELAMELYQDDSLIISSYNHPKSSYFKSFFYKMNDTISIDGAFGMFGGFGVSIKLVGDQAIVYHLLAADDFPEYALTPNDELQLRLEVPCKESKLILSHYPEAQEDHVVYGSVEFQSEPYYSGAMLIDGEEQGQRQKNSSRMKILFKSKFIDLGEE